MHTTGCVADSAGPAGNPWPHRLAVLTAAATFLLILVGGVVTNTGTGMAVPDWPTTFGYNMFLYPWSKMVGGVLYEHTHRLLGSFVGSLTLTLVIVLWAVEPRQSVRGLGIAALALAFPVSHRLVGGLMLIASLVLTLRIGRRIGWLGGEVGRSALSPGAVA